MKSLFYCADSVQVMRRMKALLMNRIAMLPEKRHAAPRRWEKRLKSCRISNRDHGRQRARGRFDGCRMRYPRSDRGLFVARTVDRWIPPDKPDITGYTHFLGSEAFGAGSPDAGTSAACPVAAGCAAALRTKLLFSRYFAPMTMSSNSSLPTSRVRQWQAALPSTSRLAFRLRQAGDRVPNSRVLPTLAEFGTILS
jgi:hypothetical protein